jgi:hypothetical protein
MDAQIKHLELLAELIDKHMDIAKIHMANLESEREEGSDEYISLKHGLEKLEEKALAVDEELTAAKESQMCARDLTLGIGGWLGPRCARALQPSDAWGAPCSRPPAAALDSGRAALREALGAAMMRARNLRVLPARASAHASLARRFRRKLLGKSGAEGFKTPASKSECEPGNAGCDIKRSRPPTHWRQ